MIPLLCVAALLACQASPPSTRRPAAPEAHWARNDPPGGGPRRLALSLSTLTARGLDERKLRPGDTLKLVASFDVPQDENRLTALPNTKADSFNRANNQVGEYTAKATVGLGHLVLRPLDATITGVVLKTASGDVQHNLSSGQEPRPEDSVDHDSLFVPIDSRDFSAGTRARVEIELAGSGGQDTSHVDLGVGLEAELRYRLVRNHPQLTLDQQEASTGHAGMTFGVATAGHLELMTLSKIYEQQHQRMQTDRAFFRRTRLAASTVDKSTHRPLTADERKQIQQSPDLEDIEEVWTDITGRTGVGQ